MTRPAIRLFDSHAHFFTNDRSRYPVDVTGAKEGEAAILKRTAHDPATDAFLLPQWDGCGIEAGAAVQFHSLYKHDNSYCIDVADRHPERVSAILMLDAAAPATPQKLRDLAGRHNVRGLRLFGRPDDHGEYPWLDSAAAMRTWEVAAELDLSMIVMAIPGVPTRAALQRAARLAERFAPLPVALDHFGWPDSSGGADGAFGPEHRELADIANLHFKFTQINLKLFARDGIDAARFLRLAVDHYGPDRIAWGSDFGNSQYSLADMVGQIVAATALLNDAERDRLLFANGMRLFGPRAAAGQKG